MTISISGANFPNLKAQPFGYDEQNVRAGVTARKWAISGLLTPSEWLSLLEVYDEWRDLRILDPDTFLSNSVGTTIQFTGTGAGGQAWDVDCWFSAAPSAEQSGAYLSVSVELVDAAQALEALLKESELSSAQNIGSYGTITLGSTTLNLIKPMEAYGSGPTLELTALGTHYVTGPLVVQRVRDVEGTTDAAGWDGVIDWYEDQIIAVPLTDSWFPISPPTVSAEVKVIAGVKTTQYTVSIQLGQVL